MDNRLPFRIVQSVSDDTTGAATANSLALAFPGPVSAGNLLLSAVSYDSGASDSPPNSFIDTRGNLWTRLGTTLYDTTGQQGTAFYYAYAKSSGSCTVTVGWSVSTIAFRIMILAEVEAVGVLGFDTSVQQLQAAPGTGANAVSSGNTTVPVEDLEILFGFHMSVIQSGITLTAGTGFTEINRTQTNVLSILTYKVMGEAKATAATCTGVGAGFGTCTSHAATFKHANAR